LQGAHDLVIEGPRKPDGQLLCMNVAALQGRARTAHQPVRRPVCQREVLPGAPHEALPAVAWRATSIRTSGHLASRSKKLAAAGAAGTREIEMSRDPWLSVEQLRKLTGLKQKAAQRRWLQKSHIPFWISQDGTPIVPLSALTGTTQTAPLNATEPDFEALLRPA
jgi:hypothetical protein